jgi:hypothetical protein
MRSGGLAYRTCSRTYELWEIKLAHSAVDKFESNCTSSHVAVATVISVESQQQCFYVTDSQVIKLCMPVVKMQVLHQIQGQELTGLCLSGGLTSSKMKTQ